MKLKYFFVLIFLFSVTRTFAGWYICYNFTGYIDKYPISLSIQLKDDHSGENPNSVVAGVYKYDKYNHPIQLMGRLDNTTTKLELSEMDGDSITAAFHLVFIKDTISGTWEQNGKTLDVKLVLKDELSDLSDEEFEGIEILQSASLPNFYFVGVYEKDSDDYRSYMSELKIIRKKDNTLYQTLDFRKLDFGVGNVMTNIHDNVSVYGNSFSITCDVGRMGGDITVSYDKDSKKFILYPEPVNILY